MLDFFMEHQNKRQRVCNYVEPLRQLILQRKKYHHIQSSLKAVNKTNVFALGNLEKKIQLLVLIIVSPISYDACFSIAEILITVANMNFTFM